MSRKPSKPETRIEDYLDVMTGGNAALPQPILRIEFYYAFLAGMAVELPQPILDDEKLLAKICGMDVEAPTYIPGISPRLYAYMAKKGGQDVEVPDPILRLERYWYDYTAGSPPSVQEYTGTVPVTFIADGTPLLDLLISGNEEHSGTPTPDNPIMPQGTGERTSNLLPEFYAASGEISGNSYTITKISIETHNDGSVLGAWYVLSEFKRYGNYANYTPIDEKHSFKIPAGTYTFSGNENIHDGNNGLRLIIGQLGQAVAGASAGAINIGVGQTFTINADSYVCPVLEIRYDSHVDEYILTNPMLNTGSTALPCEPYGIKIPISSANTTTPVYLGEVESTRKIKKLVLTGEEDYVVPNISLRVPIGIYVPAIPFVPLAVISSHFQTKNSSEGTQIDSHLYTTRLGQSGGIIWFFVPRDFFSGNLNVDNCEIEYKEWLRQQYAAGTPVTVWYVLATEETAVVNEPLMKIGNYADTLSMEQAGAQIPTASGSTTLDVETTVKPSEIYIKYRGEAVATLSSLPAEVSSPEAATEEVNPEETEEEENER